MATPFPVVSIMYFLVSSPPKTFCAVSPAFSATSVKFAMGTGVGTAALGCCADRGISIACHPAQTKAHVRMVRKTEEVENPMSPDLMLGVALAGGQASAAHGRDSELLLDLCLYHA